MQIQSIYPLFLEHPAVTTDSRNTPQGSIFFALKGISFNGNKFARQAIERGCAYAFVDEPEYADNKSIFLVDNCLTTLQQLAGFHRKQFRGKIIGITGTNGKTTTKELIAAVLAQNYHVHCTQGNLNNHIGVPLTLLQLKAKHEIAVIEMGANHPGEIKELCEMVTPDYGLITNVGKAHLEGFGSLEGVIRAKGELYDAVRKTSNTLFIRHENNYLQQIASGMTKVEYGVSPGLFVTGNLQNDSLYMSFEWQSVDSHHQETGTHLVGGYNLENALAAVAVGKFFGVDAADINAAISSYIPQNNRSQQKNTCRNSLIIDSYN
ncbi:MAG: UDP-N-acetylmuramoyl-tripeptide--D-alanyl-D-alanine ligase, partial [Bacteroidales bacterium]|nr:UDP-N-acetylmuramoyl-tripeptide--D-alanyl-D-alanine ligase [Bacteroidales bacterium]